MDAATVHWALTRTASSRRRLSASQTTSSSGLTASLIAQVNNSTTTTSCCCCCCCTPAPCHFTHSRLLTYIFHYDFVSFSATSLSEFYKRSIGMMHKSCLRHRSLAQSMVTGEWRSASSSWIVTRKYGTRDTWWNPSIRRPAKHYNLGWNGIRQRWTSNEHRIDEDCKMPTKRQEEKDLKSRKFLLLKKYFNWWVGKANSAFGRLIWENKRLSIKSKIGTCSIYTALWSWNMERDSHKY